MSAYVCKICGVRPSIPFPHAGMECEVCCEEIRDGTTVQERNNHRMTGTAFIKNSAGQWLVLWKTGPHAGHFDIIHQNNLERGHYA